MIFFDLTIGLRVVIFILWMVFLLVLLIVFLLFFGLALRFTFFFVNIFYSMWKGKDSGPNPWRATTLEWQTPDTPPKHGNWGHELPQVYRWAYDYSVPGYADDFIPQNVPPDKAPAGRTHGVTHGHGREE